MMLRGQAGTRGAAGWRSFILLPEGLFFFPRWGMKWSCDHDRIPGLNLVPSHPSFNVPFFLFPILWLLRPDFRGLRREDGEGERRWVVGTFPMPSPFPPLTIELDACKGFEARGTCAHWFPRQVVFLSAQAERVFFFPPPLLANAACKNTTTWTTSALGSPGKTLPTRNRRKDERDLLVGARPPPLPSAECSPSPPFPSPAFFTWVRLRKGNTTN